MPSGKRKSGNSIAFAQQRSGNCRLKTRSFRSCGPSRRGFARRRVCAPRRFAAGNTGLRRVGGWSLFSLACRVLRWPSAGVRVKASAPGDL